MKKGVALVSLVTVIVILAIITSAVSIGAYQNIKSSVTMDFARELKNVEDFFRQYVSEHDSYPTKGVVTIEGENISNFPLEQQDNGKVTLLEINTEKIGLVSLRRGDKSKGNLDVYAYSPKTNKIYYPKGVYEYYNLSEKLYAKLKINNEQILETSSKVDLSKVSNLNNSVNYLDDFKIEVPNNYNFTPEIRVTNGGTYKLLSKEDVYTYEIIPPTVLKPFDIIINYKDSNGKIQTYVKQIENIDKEAPILNDVFIQKQSIEGKDVYFVSNVTFEDKSKIKKVKYVNKKVSLDSAKEYILKEGNDVENSQITVIDPKDKNITIYCEDEASNYNIYYITLQ